MSTQTTSNVHAFLPGTKVTVAERHRTIADGHNYPAFGTVYTVESCRTTGNGFVVRLEDLRSEYGTSWFVLADSPAEREYIPFTLTKETSKAYALKSNSRALAEEHRLTLDKAAKGQEVDAWAFHTAVTAALSLAATRHGQSMGRRDYTKMARHLLYISGAVIENSLRGLPPVDPGTRSPKIEEQKRQIVNLGLTLATERGRTADLIREKSDLEIRIEKLQDDLHEVETDWRNLAASAKINSDVLEYAMGLLSNLDDVALGQAFGYRDALEAKKA